MRPINSQGHSPLPFNPMEIEIDLSLGNGYTFTLPINGAGYEFNVDWGDGYSEFVNSTSPVGHTYAPVTRTVYTIKITGLFSRFYFNNSVYAPMVTSVDIGGLDVTYKGSDFDGCDNLDFVNITKATSLLASFRNNDNGTLNGVENIDTSLVTDMQQTFFKTRNFNQNINSWNVSSVTTFANFFRDNTVYNQPMDSWDVSSSTSLGGMFRGCSSFNQDISGWVINGVIGGMFYGCSSFNQDISGWNTTPTTVFNNTFIGCSIFNQDISTWDVSNGTSFLNMLRNCTNFNQNLGAWNIDNASDLQLMFLGSGLSDLNCQLTIEGWFTWDGTQVTNTTQSNVLCGFNNNTINSSSDAGKIVAWMTANRGWTFTNLTLA